MKNFLYLIALSATICGCSSKKEDTSYAINGHVKNLSADIVYLRLKKIAPDGHIYWPKVDSAEVSDGSFTLNRDSSIKEPSMAMIAYNDNDGKPISIKYFNSHEQRDLDYFVLENAKIDISGNVNTPNSVLIKGSKETDFVYQYQREFFRRVLMIDLKLDSLEKIGNKKAPEKLSDERARLRAPLNACLKKILTANREVYQTVHLLYANQRSLTGAELEEFIKLLDKKLLQTNVGAQLEKLIALKKSQETSN